MKKNFFFLLPLILTTLCFLGETSILKAQENTTWFYVGYCELHRSHINIHRCIACGEWKELSDFHAKCCGKCYLSSSLCLVGGCRNPIKHKIPICWDCATKDLCYAPRSLCGEYLGSGDVPTAASRDKRRILAKYTVQITIPGKKEEFMKNYNAANEAITKGDYQQALNYFRKCDEIIPNGVACQIGISLRGLKKEVDAVKYFDIAIKEEPNYAEPYYQKGLVLIGQSKFTEAEELLKKAIQLNIWEGNAYLMYAYLLESERKDYNQAITHYERGFDLSPTTSSFRGNLISLYQQAGKFDDALKHADVLCELLDSSVEALNTKAELLFNFNKWNDAIPIYEKLISMKPNNVHIAYYYLGLCQYQVAQFEKARDNWEKTIELDENKNPETYSCLAVCEMKLNNPVNAKKYCEETLARVSKESSFIYYNLACAYSLMNEKDKGLEFLEKALKTGQVNISYMESDADLKNVRESKGYKELVAKYK